MATMEELRGRFSQLDTLVTQGVDGSNVQTIIGGMRDFIKLMLEEQVTQHQQLGDVQNDVATAKITSITDGQNIAKHDTKITQLDQSVQKHETTISAAQAFVQGLDGRISWLESNSVASSTVAAVSARVDQLHGQLTVAADINQQIQQLSQSVANLQSGSGSASISRTDKPEKRGIMESRAIG